MALVVAEHMPPGIARAFGKVLNNPVLGMAEPFLDPENAANIKLTVEAMHRQRNSGTINAAAARQLDELMAEDARMFAPPAPSPAPPAGTTAAVYVPPSVPAPTPPSSSTITVPAPSVPPPSPSVAPPSPSSPPTTQLPSSYNTPPTPVQVAVVQAPPPAPPTPGGISLSFAAAAGLAVNLDLEGLHAGDGRLTLTGRSGSKQTVEAPLFLTAMRLACERTSPFMSLDPDDGTAWSRDTSRAGDEVWDEIKQDFGYATPLSSSAKEGLEVRSVSLRRDYPKVYSRIMVKYPSLKSRLVFRPQWLKETRFGEIMYTADVLLKELSAGVPTVRPGRELRAASIDGYRPSDVRGTVQGLVENVGSLPSTSSGTSSWRLWFDLAPDGLEASPEFRPALSMLDDETGGDAASLKLKSLLDRDGYLSDPPGASVTRAVAVSNGAVDLSQVWPQMFVRGHDHASGKDVRGMSPDLIRLSVDVNRRIAGYAATYDELRQLTDIFRLYVAAVSVADRNPKSCEAVKILPILDTEKPRSAMPDHHQTELAFTVASFTYKDKDQTRRWHYQTNTFNGGVAIRAADVYEKAKLAPEPTPITQEAATEATSRPTEAAWQGRSGRDYLALTLDEPDFIGALKYRGSLKAEKMLVLMHPRLAVALLDQPSRSGGMLDGQPDAPARALESAKGGGLLDDVTAKEGNIVILPSR